MKRYRSIAARIVAILCLVGLSGEAATHRHAETALPGGAAHVAAHTADAADAPAPDPTPHLVPDEGHEQHRATADASAGACAFCRSGHGRDRATRPAPPEWLVLAATGRLRPAPTPRILPVAHVRVHPSRAPPAPLA